ncbi:hypothetical protein [Streptomyces clavifer]|uniref:hypothetical protein n=1 Tax=Streptomyces clavifer TaxID=68188 RepID=UPI0033B81A3B
MPDLLAGTTVLGLDTPPGSFANDGTDIINFSNTTFSSGSPIVGVVFTAPTTGRVWVHWQSRFNPTSAIAVQVGFALRTDGVLGSGTLLQDGLNENCLESANVSGGGGRVQGGSSYLLTGLTPGSVYNVVVCHRMTAAGTGTIFARSIGVAPCT